MQERILYFNEGLHRYTDEFNNVYKSTTTLVGEYTTKFDTDALASACEKIGRNPNHPKYEVYKGMKAWQIKDKWSNTAKVACEKGTLKHAIAETSIKEANNYKVFKGNDGFDYVQLYTINKLLNTPNIGKLNLDIFAQTEMCNEFPLLYSTVHHLANEGWYVYSEVGVYHPELFVSGLIDLPLFKGKKFIIGDWKTNKDPITFECGYYEKDNKGNTTDKWVSKDETFKYPIHHLNNSIGNKIAMQLSTYAWLLEQWGFECQGLFVGHITNEQYGLTHNVPESWWGKDVAKLLTIPYLKNEVADMMAHYKVNKIVEHKQVTMF